MDDRLVLDLMRDPKIAARIGRVDRVVTPIVTVTASKSTGDALDVQFSVSRKVVERAQSLRTALSDSAL